MKKVSISLLLVSILLVAAGCSSNSENEKTSEEKAETQTTSKPQEQEAVEEDAATDEETPADLSNGSDTVLQSLQKLKTTTETEKDNIQQIQQAGKELKESWDSIEEQVEEKYPEDYEFIEESLYPLIAEAEKDQPDIEKMKQLITDTIEKVEAFKKKVTAS